MLEAQRLVPDTRKLRQPAPLLPRPMDLQRDALDARGGLRRRPCNQSRTRFERSMSLRFIGSSPGGPVRGVGIGVEGEAELGHRPRQPRGGGADRDTIASATCSTSGPVVAEHDDRALVDREPAEPWLDLVPSVDAGELSARTAPRSRRSSAAACGDLPDGTRERWRHQVDASKRAGSRSLGAVRHA